MIDKESFTLDWINGHKKEKKFSRINPPVLEKMIRALALLEALVVHELGFTFKGGTCLILLLPEPRRFSVDIDILTEHSREELEKAFDQIVKGGSFTGWSVDEPRSYKKGVPKAHYFFYYESLLNKHVSYILLDILFEKHHYPVVKKIPIVTPWLSSKGDPAMVTAPTIDSILGDKLTAFAPNTTGVPYGKEKSLEIAKQLHDVGHLFDHIKDANITSAAFASIVQQEIKYRDLDVTADQVLDDVIATSLLIGMTQKHRTNEEKPKFEEISRGILQFSGYLMTGGFYIDHAIESASKAAYLAAKLKLKDHTAVNRYKDGEETTFQFETMPHNVLNRLRKLKNGSMHYWWQTAMLLGIK
jgi:predicted nucleotidyltransferase component of viral defense system